MCYVKLKHLRKNYGYTLDDMAKKLKISKTYYWQIEVIIESFPMK